MAELLFWPALFAYGEAAVAYAGNARHPGRAGRLATWGVRVGWLLQTALLVVQAVRSDGFPWDTWAGSLNLFVWLVVTAYLFWGCRTRYRLLGLVVMPLRRPCSCSPPASAARPQHAEARTRRFLVLHVGLVLTAFAGFTLAAGLAAVYLWQERRLKHRRPGGLLGRAPSLVTLDTLDRASSRSLCRRSPPASSRASSAFVRTADPWTR